MGFGVDLSAFGFGCLFWVCLICLVCVFVLVFCLIEFGLFDCCDFAVDCLVLRVALSLCFSLFVGGWVLGCRLVVSLNLGVWLFCVVCLFWCCGFAFECFCCKDFCLVVFLGCLSFGLVGFWFV